MRHLSQADFRAIAKAHANTTPVAVERVKLGSRWMHQLVATKDIPRSTVVAVYPVEIFHDDDDDINRWDYSISIFNLSGNELDFTGIPTKASLAAYTKKSPAPVGMFLNEPTHDQTPNAKMKFPHISAKKDPRGTFALATIVTTRRVNKGDVITWCYGDRYERNYKTPCK